MQSALTPDTLLEKVVGIPGPWTSGLKRKAYRAISSRMPEISMFVDSGFDAVADERRKRIMVALAATLGATGKEEFGFHLWLWNECMGERTPARYVFYRCLVCQEIRTHRSVCRGSCRCGSTRRTNWVPEITTKKALRALLLGH